MSVVNEPRSCHKRSRCFYCLNSDENNVQMYSVYHDFGILYCSEHAAEAKRDCEEYMRTHKIVRRRDAISHPILGPFISALGSNIPVIRNSGAIETNWRFQEIDDWPFLQCSYSKGWWGFNLTNGVHYKFVNLEQLRDPRISQYINGHAYKMIDTVINTLNAGIY